MATNIHLPKNSSTWKVFTTASFAIAASKIASGTHLNGGTICREGFYPMGATMLEHTAITIVRTEGARTEMLPIQVRK